MAVLRSQQPLWGKELRASNGRSWYSLGYLGIIWDFLLNCWNWNCWNWDKKRFGSPFQRMIGAAALRRTQFFFRVIKRHGFDRWTPWTLALESGETEISREDMVLLGLDLWKKNTFLLWRNPNLPMNWMTSTMSYPWRILHSWVSHLEGPTFGASALIHWRNSCRTWWISAVAICRYCCGYASNLTSGSSWEQTVMQSWQHHECCKLHHCINGNWAGLLRNHLFPARTSGICPRHITTSPSSHMQVLGSIPKPGNFGRPRQHNCAKNRTDQSFSYVDRNR